MFYGSVFIVFKVYIIGKGLLNHHYLFAFINGDCL